MNKSSMYNEIMDQYDVVENLINERWKETLEINKLLHEADEIIFLGTGASLNACYAVRETAIKYIGKIPHIIEMAEAKNILQTVTHKTLCFLVSQSGKSKETIDGIKLMKDSSAIKIAVTNDENSYLALNCNRKLILNTGKEISSATKTFTASIILMQMALCAHDDRAVADMKKLPGLIKTALETLPKSVSTVAKLLKDEKAFYIGALGSLYPTARQGALLIKEKDFILTEGLSISELRHGTVEAVYENMPIFILGFNELVDESISHAKYFANHVKANTYLITDRNLCDKDTMYKTIYIYNSENSTFCDICPTIFFQLLAENIAELKGYDIDGFKYLNKVVENY